MTEKLLRKIKDDGLLLILSFGFFISILTAYITVVYPEFHEGLARMPFELDYDNSKIVVVVFSLLLSFLGIFIRDGFVKTVWYILLMYLYYSSLIYYLFNDAVYGIVLQNIILLLFIFLADFVNVKIPSISINLDIQRYHSHLLVISLLLLIPFLFYLPYIDISNLWLHNIYKIRHEFREISIPIADYLVSPLSRVLFPVLFLFFLHKKNYKALILPLIGILYIFLCGATKSIFFGLFAAILFYFGRTYIDKIKIFAILFISLSILGVASYLFLNNKLIVDVLIRRLFFIPPYLDNIYYQYFTDNYTYWTHSHLSLGFYHSFFDYGNSLSMYVGEEVIGIEGLNANTGILTEGYASLSYIGVIIHSVFYALIIAFIKNLRVSPIYFGIVFAYIYVLNTSIISTLILTHGLLFMLLIFAFSLKNTQE
jgi:hypothetical protein